LHHLTIAFLALIVFTYRLIAFLQSRKNRRAMPPTASLGNQNQNHQTTQRFLTSSAYIRLTVFSLHFRPTGVEPGTEIPMGKTETGLSKD
jgi:hypothetical protein